MAVSVDLPALTLVGPGRAGSTLARCWSRAGGRVAAVLARRIEDAKGLAVEVGARAGSPTDPGLGEAELIVLAVSDDAIFSVAQALAPRTAAATVLHLSGARSSADLSPFSERGASVASLHPLRPFTGRPGEGWEDAVVAVEGDEQAARLGEEIARRLGARPHRLAPGAKPLYHLGATLAAGGTMALLSAAASLWVEAGLSEADARRSLSGLAEHAARGFGQARQAAEAFTGPVARRDLETIRAHWRQLEGRPDLAFLYSALARETLDQTRGRGLEAEVLEILGGPHDR